MHNSKLLTQIGMGLGVAAFAALAFVQQSQAAHTAMSTVGLLSVFAAAFGKALGADGEASK